MSSKFTEYDLPLDAYATFDATSMKRLLTDRLTEKGVYTDQIFEGSNMSAIMDVVAYSYHVLMYYLNRTANESMFSQSEIYENMNRIVKLLDYKPIGYKTSVLPIELHASKDLSKGVYTIPRYSYITAGGVTYSFVDDVTFAKSTVLDERIAEVSDTTMLFQGKFIEYPDQVATGEPFETISLGLNDAISIDHTSIHVYVKSVRDGIYRQYEEVSSLYFSNPDDIVYEKRYNENGLYEFTFGNNVNGSQLNVGDTIKIIYLQSDKQAGEIGSNTINNQPLTLYTSVTFADVQKDVKPANIEYISFVNAKYLQFSNIVNSTSIVEPEGVDQIRKNAPEFFRIQNRLVTSDDYSSFINRRYGNIINDVKVVSNAEYLDGHIRYLNETLGLQTPSMESRVLYNQVNYADSNNFNNIHLYIVPKVINRSSNNILINFLAPSQKTTIRAGLQNNKMITDEPVFQDPVYMGMSFGVLLPGETLTTDVINKSRFVVERAPFAKRNADEIKQRAYSILINKFSHGTASLGQTIDISEITSELVSIEGVQSVYMTRADVDSYRVTGLSMIVWNPVYGDRDITLVNQNITLPYFKYPYIYDAATLFEMIDVTQAES